MSGTDKVRIRQKRGNDEMLDMGSRKMEKPSGVGEEINHVWEIVEVPLGSQSYEILIGPGLLTDIAKDIEAHVPAHRYILLTDSVVEDYLGYDLLAVLREAGLAVDLISFPAGEASKRMDTVVDLARRMVDLGADRQTVILALGGGVVGDVAGFLASMYMRGIRYTQLPTTLLAQVDSSVGGKTGVDLPEGKNLLGTFYQPKRVYADIGVLVTLPRSELRNGLAEVVKYGMIRSPELFSLLEERAEDVLNLAPEVLADVVAWSCAIKAEVVAADEREGGLRRILNFGHTVGHAVEAAADYQIPHGEAVAMGMVAVTKLSVAKGLLPPKDGVRLLSLLEKLGLSTTIPPYLPTGWLIDLLQHDKKARAGRVHFVLCREIGETVITDEVGVEELARAIEATRA